MLHSNNSGKYLYGKYARDRAKVVEDKEKFDTAEQTWLEVSGNEGTRYYQEKTYRMASTPIDSQTSVKQKAGDLRLLPQMGGVVD